MAGNSALQGKKLKGDCGMRRGILWAFAQVKGRIPSFLALIVFTIVNGLSGLCVSLLMKAFIDIATYSSNLQPMFVVALAIADLAVLGVTEILVSVLQNRIACFVEKTLRRHLLDKLYRIPLQTYNSQPTSVYLTRMTLDVEAVVKFLTDTSIVSIFNECLLFLVSVFLIFALNWKMALVLLTVFPLFLLCILRLSPKVHEISGRISKEEEKNRTLLQEFLDKALLIRAYNTCVAAIRKMEAQYGAKQSLAYRRSVLLGVMGFLNNFMGVGMFLIAMGFGVFLVLSGETTMGSLVAMVNLVSFYYGPFLHISRWVSDISSTRAAVQRIREILDQQDDDRPLAAPADGQRIEEVRVEDLTFAYEGHPPVLRDVSALFAKGKVTAVVGESGSGKSTLLNNILGFYQPSAGRVLGVCGDGTVLTGRLQNAIAYDSVNTSVLYGTLRENICMGDAWDEERFQKTIRAVHLEAFYEEKGADFLLESGGKNLSSGQIRRVSLARALYRDRDILLFDEPTVNLDAESIEAFWQNVERLKADRICLIVTHDPRIVALCDVVYSLEEGRLFRRDEAR